VGVFDSESTELDSTFPTSSPMSCILVLASSTLILDAKILPDLLVSF